MGRFLFYIGCCLALLHSTLALPIVLPRDGVTETKPQSVRQKLCLFTCWDGWDDDYYWPDPPPPERDDNCGLLCIGDDYPPPPPPPADPYYCPGLICLGGGYPPPPPPPPHRPPPPNPPPSPHGHHPHPTDPDDWPPCEGICIGFESTEGPAGSLAGAQEKSVAKSTTTSEPTIAQGTKESSAAESGKQKSSVAPSGHGES
ncbi:hypothetical protein PCANC_03621 [Puccinia coronata f. sp. avenae]|uniref:Uncharacterized protein n=1 Tax=Puccinia coronata f. sp. avenae TaxID=200324 RepID=A0A2N5TCV8_9BASI|nr:hypothetical protein PCASD_10981 [Puccinia coronata f. sp. avenae]PLW36195.1 hypothetical protein PCASD_10456 [Puccinia coronata f. sp. avenae]PLW53769.1 hypothetical protein PCANC_03621 [Puccinia coronata f. sp. avenae]